MRCRSKTVDGKRCKRQCLSKNSECWQHNKIQKGSGNISTTTTGASTSSKSMFYWKHYSQLMLTKFSIDMLDIDTGYQYYSYGVFSKFFKQIDIINPIFGSNYILNRQITPAQDTLLFGDGSLTNKHISERYPKSYVDQHRHLDSFTVDIDALRNPNLIYVMGADPHLPKILLNLNISTIIFEGFFLNEPFDQMPYFFRNILELLHKYELNYVFVISPIDINDVGNVHIDEIRQKVSKEDRMRKKMPLPSRRTIDIKNLYRLPLPNLLLK